MENSIVKNYDTDQIFPKKTGPPGKGGIEITAKDGKNVSSPVSNFYCSGYRAE